MKFLEEYGTVWKMKTCFDIDNLMVADPLALQHILHTSGYSYPKRVDVNHSAKLVVGDGIVVAIGGILSIFESVTHLLTLLRS